MTCREAIDRLAEYLDAELTPATLAELETHLAACAPCLAYLATYRETRELAAKAHRVEIPEALRARLGQLLMARRRPTETRSLLDIPESMLYVSALSGDVTLPILRGIDYFC